MNGVRPIRFHEVVGLVDCGAAGAGLLVQLEAEGPGRSWFALLASGAHDPAALQALDLKDAEPVRPDCPRCYGTAMSLPYDCVRTCEECGGWRWMGNSLIFCKEQEERMRRDQLLPGQAEWRRRRWAHIRALRGEDRQPRPAAGITGARTARPPGTPRSGCA